MYKYTPYPIQLIGENPLKQISKYSNQAKTKEQKFLNLYKHLSEDYIFQTDDILPYFLNRDILKTYIDIDIEFKKYMTAIPLFLNSMPYLTKTLNTTHTVENLINLFREDKFDISWHNSDDYTNQQIVNDIINSRTSDN